jgi:hypothetical protein
MQDLAPHQRGEALREPLRIGRHAVHIDRLEVAECPQYGVECAPQREGRGRRGEGRGVWGFRGAGVVYTLGGREAERAQRGAGLELREERKDGGERVCGDVVQEQVDEIRDGAAPDVDVRCEGGCGMSASARDGYKKKGNRCV